MSNFKQKTFKVDNLLQMKLDEQAKKSQSPSVTPPDKRRVRYHHELSPVPNVELTPSQIADLDKPMIEWLKESKNQKFNSQWIKTAREMTKAILGNRLPNGTEKEKYQMGVKILKDLEYSNLQVYFILSGDCKNMEEMKRIQENTGQEIDVSSVYQTFLSSQSCFGNPPVKPEEPKVLTMSLNELQRQLNTGILNRNALKDAEIAEILPNHPRVGLKNSTMEVLKRDFQQFQTVNGGLLLSNLLDVQGDDQRLLIQKNLKAIMEIQKTSTSAIPEMTNNTIQRWFFEIWLKIQKTSGQNPQLLEELEGLDEQQKNQLFEHFKSQMTSMDTPEKVQGFLDQFQKFQEAWKILNGQKTSENLQNVQETQKTSEEHHEDQMISQKTSEAVNVIQKTSQEIQDPQEVQETQKTSGGQNPELLEKLDELEHQKVQLFDQFKNQMMSMDSPEKIQGFLDQFQKFQEALKVLNGQKTSEEGPSVQKTSEIPGDVQETQKTPESLEELQEVQKTSETHQNPEEHHEVQPLSQEMSEVLQKLQKTSDAVNEIQKTSPEPEVAQKTSDAVNEIQKTSKKIQDLQELQEVQKTSESLPESFNVQMTSQELQKTSPQKQNLPEPEDIEMTSQETFEKQQNLQKTSQEHQKVQVTQKSEEVQNLEALEDVQMTSPQISEKPQNLQKTSAEQEKPNDDLMTSEELQEFLKPSLTSPKIPEVEEMSQKHREILETSPREQNIEKTSEDYLEIVEHVQKTSQNHRDNLPTSPKQKNIQKTSEDNLETLQDVQKTSQEHRDVLNTSDDVQQTENVDMIPHKLLKLLMTSDGQQNSQASKELQNSQKTSSELQNPQMTSSEPLAQKQLLKEKFQMFQKAQNSENSQMTFQEPQESIQKNPEDVTTQKTSPSSQTRKGRFQIAYLLGEDTQETSGPPPKKMKPLEKQKTSVELLKTPQNPRNQYMEFRKKWQEFYELKKAQPFVLTPELQEHQTLLMMTQKLQCLQKTSGDNQNTQMTSQSLQSVQQLQKSQMTSAQLQNHQMTTQTVPNPQMTSQTLQNPQMTSPIVQNPEMTLQNIQHLQAHQKTSGVIQNLQTTSQSFGSVQMTPQQLPHLQMLQMTSQAAQNSQITFSQPQNPQMTSRAIQNPPIPPRRASNPQMPSQACQKPRMKPRRASNPQMTSQLPKNSEMTFPHVQNLPSTSEAHRNSQMTAQACQTPQTTFSQQQNPQMTFPQSQNLPTTSQACQNPQMTSQVPKNPQMTFPQSQNLPPTSQANPKRQMTLEELQDFLKTIQESHNSQMTSQRLPNPPLTSQHLQNAPMMLEPLQNQQSTSQQLQDLRNTQLTAEDLENPQKTLEALQKMHIKYRQLQNSEMLSRQLQNPQNAQMTSQQLQNPQMTSPQQLQNPQNPPLTSSQLQNLLKTSQPLQNPQNPPPMYRSPTPPRKTKTVRKNGGRTTRGGGRGGRRGGRRQINPETQIFGISRLLDLPINSTLPIRPCPTDFDNYLRSSLAYGETYRSEYKCPSVFHTMWCRYLISEDALRPIFMEKKDFVIRVMNEVWRWTLYEVQEEEKLINFLNRHPEYRLHPNFASFTDSHMATKQKLVPITNEQKMAEKNLIIKSFNYLSQHPNQNEVNFATAITFVLFNIFLLLEKYSKQGFRAIRDVLSQYYVQKR